MSETSDKITHTDACLARARAEREFDAANPGVCKTCGGRGGWSTSGTYHTPPDGGPCGCVESGHCPRCGAEGLRLISDDDLFDWSHCDPCGWDERLAMEDPNAYPARPRAECYCWEEGY